MKVIAIDPGYDRIGIALVEKREQKEEVIFSESFITERSDTFSHRIFSIGERIAYLIEKYQPQYFAIEKLFFSRNTKTALQVAEARGVMLYQAERYHLPIYEYTPNQIKVAVTGNGNSSKKDILFMVEKLISLQEKKRIDDELDALALALTFFASFSLHQK